MEKFQAFCFAILPILFCVSWLASSAVSAWKESHRHAEISNVIEYLILDRNKNFEFAASVINTLAKQKSLIVVRDEDGVLQVKALDTAEREEVRKEFERQDTENN